MIRKPWLIVLIMLIETGSVFGLSGAIFTTLEDGSAVNHNIYESAEDVYLDGGPGPHAPIGTAGLPEGDYYFQVTDPSGKVLLSEDPVECRYFHVNDQGVIDRVYPAFILQKIRGKMTQANCTHNTGIDIDHGDQGAITVQLYPFSKTPNNGGVYKVWVTPINDFTGEGQFHGFVPRYSKTDNFKVKRGKPFDPPIIIIRKFDDSNANGIVDPGEEEIIGWPVLVTDPLGVENAVYTPATIIAVPTGSWLICEQTHNDWMVTSDECQIIEVSSSSGETYEILFLNIQLGSITACKGYDQNGDGVDDNIPVEGFKICIEGTAVNGTLISKYDYTSSDGCVTFEDLLPGNYTMSEVVPDGWYASSPTSVLVTLSEDEDESVQFLNFCKGKVAMHTKGFWQNQGCSIVNQDDLDYLAGLAPYKTGNITTNGQDNCGGVACPDSIDLPLASVNELVCYIVAPNSQSNRIGLAQQLTAFILNCRHESALDAALVLDIGIVNIQDIITAAIDAWETGQDVSFWQGKLDEINNTSSVDFIAGSPCSVNY